MGYYQRKLPHWDPEGKALFITWRLYGSLPANFCKQVGTGLPPRPGWGRGACPVPVTRQEPRHHPEPTFPSQKFLAADRCLDRALTGPMWLKDGRVSRCVVDTLLFAERKLKLYELHSYVVMANHVHVLLWPDRDLISITRKIKSFTASEANRILQRSGKRFWQEESFDHWIRTMAEYSRIATYIEWNPVSAGLVKKPEDWPWSSAAGRDGAGAPSPPGVSSPLLV